ncbi:4-hydroxy-3-methylbut-2-enyl diphosphate reductase [Candidatus Tachikawaea gelatinosa]|uniref:4-hydroxy-3-methylbut-2-enyl diphosphate reductase n=1 Tax=Candidatus Tachikawaea gelatinosa TaxID=1410383 RepID=A0A090AK46_9ENTR|nr:4-hydroxy-3-methylbut-2-enyl diphosphate reductase [Candidatus Tachikawaea gelatinosa]BAP58798.1 4-hydroxy-3-methylbut-2-enyl diphosphate reductase [Candidatus Tachikawaea gelatinosa]
MNIFLANPRGFCAGVNRAINIVNLILKIYGQPIYVYHEIVHNSHVLNVLRKKGVVFVENIENVPKRSILIFSAHGVSKNVQNQAKKRNLKIFDATCPLVKKVHKKVCKASDQGIEVILIGNSYHPEIKGTIGQYINNKNGGIYLIESFQDVLKIKINNPSRVVIANQTTLSTEEVYLFKKILIKKFPKINISRSDICYATTNRQIAVQKLAEKTEIVFVIGSKNSSNSNRLVEIVKKYEKKSYLIDSISDIKKICLNNIKNIGITAGASTPDVIINQIIKYLCEIKNTSVIELSGIKENFIFKIPKSFYRKPSVLL